MSLGCAGCGLEYGGEAWCDVLIADEAWLQISPNPSGGGVLCFNCITKRLVEKGLTDVPMMVVSGPFERDPRDGDGQWLVKGAPTQAEVPMPASRHWWRSLWRFLTLPHPEVHCSRCGRLLTFGIEHRCGR